MARSIEIKKEGGRWKVIRDNPSERIHRGHQVKWELHPDPDEPKKPISAHFQFTDYDLLEDMPNQNRLSADLTAEIPEPGQTLILKLQKGTCRRRNPRYYAVWIADATLPGQGVFAVGESGNPPPEMDIGGP